MNGADLEFASPIGARFVPLYGKKAAGRVALVDEADYELISQYHWNVNESLGAATAPPIPYAICASVPGPRKLMHTLIAGWRRTDHIDHDGLNNQRSNLREATNGQNMANRRKMASPATSRFKGVSRNGNKRRNVWTAQIQFGKVRYLGSYPTELEAALVYDTAAREFFGEFAYVNFPDAAKAQPRQEYGAA